MSTPKTPSLPAIPPAPGKTDAAIQLEAEQARLMAQRRQGRRSTVLTTAREPAAQTTSGSLSAAGSATRLGAA